jgi:uncharacterized protein with ATP-grasp and redox domains
MAAGGDEGLRGRAIKRASELLDDPVIENLTSPEIANRMLEAIRDETGVRDPYASFKRREMEQARKVFEGLDVPEGLEGLSALAAAGNSLDFFMEPSAALSTLGRQIGDGAFFIDHRARFKEFMARRPALVLYLTDNAGEIFFDAPLYEHLRGMSGRVVLAVKGGPSVNDLTREDLLISGINTADWEVTDTGTDGAGIEWSSISARFQGLLEGADLILSKGMANFETLYQVDLRCPALFLFKVKCRPIMEYLAAPKDAHVALWKEKDESFIK